MLACAACCCPGWVMCEGGRRATEGVSHAAKHRRGALSPWTQADHLNQFDAVILTFIRLFFPIWFAYLMIMVAFRIGVKKKRDRWAPAPQA